MSVFQAPHIAGFGIDPLIDEQDVFAVFSEFFMFVNILCGIAEAAGENIAEALAVGNHHQKLLQEFLRSVSLPGHAVERGKLETGLQMIFSPIPSRY